MKVLLIGLIFSFAQAPATIVKNNGEQIVLSEVLFYQTGESGSSEKIIYSYRGSNSSISLKQVKRISFKETVKRKKGIVTYKVILVKNNNDKLEVEVDMVRLEGKNKNGKSVSMNCSSIDKVSF
ncbi:hypothetical protein [Ekhidna sp.]